MYIKQCTDDSEIILNFIICNFFVIKCARFTLKRLTLCLYDVSRGTCIMIAYISAAPRKQPHLPVYISNFEYIVHGNRCSFVFILQVCTLALINEKQKIYYNISFYTCLIYLQTISPNSLRETV